MDVEAVLSAAASDLDDDRVAMQAAAAVALESDQLVTQAVAAREEEVSHFQKLGPLLQEKIQFFCERGWCHLCLSWPAQ